MPFGLFNGSYLSKRNTGIGVVAKNLIQFLSPDIFRILDPLHSDRDGCIPIPQKLSPNYGMRGHIRRLFWMQTQLPLILKKSGAEFLMSPLPEIPLFSSVPSIVLAHDLIPIRYPSFSFLTLHNATYVPLVFNQAKLIFCNSISTATDINKFYGIPFSKLYPIRLGFDKSKFYNLNLTRENFFLIIGRHNPHKNLQRVLRSFALLSDKNFKLIFVGPIDARYTPSLQRLAKELNISDRCIWKGWVSDKEKLFLLNKCHALLLLSLWEGFGLSALEAMACGTTVLVSNKGALKEVVGDVGYSVDPLDVMAITSLMNEIINNYSLLKLSAKQGPNRAALFNWEQTAREIEKILIDKL